MVAIPNASDQREHLKLCCGNERCEPGFEYAVKVTREMSFVEFELI